MMTSVDTIETWGSTATSYYLDVEIDGQKTIVMMNVNPTTTATSAATETLQAWGLYARAVEVQSDESSVIVNYNVYSA